MKIYGENIFIGDKCICTEYTSKIIGNIEDSRIGEKSHKGKTLEKDVLFIKDKQGYYVDVRDTEGLGSFALKFFGAAQRWVSNPHNAGDLYVDVKPYFEKSHRDSIYTLEELLIIANASDEKTL